MTQREAQIRKACWYCRHGVSHLREVHDAEIEKGRRTMANTRVFDTGANRDTDDGKLDFEGFVSPFALEAFGKYMNFNRYLPDGSLQDSDNWQKGIPLPVYMKSLWRHFLGLWKCHRCLPFAPKTNKKAQAEQLCAIIFNAQGYLHELLKDDPELMDKALADMERRRQEEWGAQGADFIPRFISVDADDEEG